MNRILTTSARTRAARPPHPEFKTNEFVDPHRQIVFAADQVRSLVKAQDARLRERRPDNDAVQSRELLGANGDPTQRLRIPGAVASPPGCRRCYRRCAAERPV